MMQILSRKKTQKAQNLGMDTYRTGAMCELGARGKVSRKDAKRCELAPTKHNGEKVVLRYHRNFLSKEEELRVVSPDQR